MLHKLILEVTKSAQWSKSFEGGGGGGGASCHLMSNRVKKLVIFSHLFSQRSVDALIRLLNTNGDVSGKYKIHFKN